MDQKIIFIGLGLMTLAGCAHDRAENKPLAQYPGIQGQIESFYDANAVEDDWVCNSPRMASIDKSQVVSQSPTQVRMAVTYYFSSSDESSRSGGGQCQGFHTRIFTFDKGPSNQLTLDSMSGAQRGGRA